MELTYCGEREGVGGRGRVRRRGEGGGETWARRGLWWAPGIARGRRRASVTASGFSLSSVSMSGSSSSAWGRGGGERSGGRVRGAGEGNQRLGGAVPSAGAGSEPGALEGVDNDWKKLA